MTKTIQEITDTWNLVKHETQEDANTALRVGGAGADLAEYVRSVEVGVIDMPSVDTYNDTTGGKTSLLTSYPNPELGWTVLVNDENNNYKWNGTEWVNKGSGAMLLTSEEGTSNTKAPTQKAWTEGLGSIMSNYTANDTTNVRTYIYVTNNPLKTELTFTSNLSIVDKRNNNRCFMFPANTVFPKTITIDGQNKTLAIDRLSIKGQFAGYLTESDLITVDYMSIGEPWLKQYIPLISTLGSNSLTFGILEEIIQNSRPYSQTFNYEIVNTTGLKITNDRGVTSFSSNPIISNKSTNHRRYLFPQNTVFPKTVTMSENSVLLVNVKSVNAGGVALGYLAESDLVIKTLLETDISVLQNYALLDQYSNGYHSRGLLDTYFRIADANKDITALDTRVVIQENKSVQLENSIAQTNTNVTRVEKEANDKIVAVGANAITQEQLNTATNNLLHNDDQVRNIADGAVGVDKLSQEAINMINSAGGGTITNQTDGEDTITVESKIKLNDTDVVRFRVKSTGNENYTELQRCLSQGQVIQIKDVVDLAYSNGGLRPVTLTGQTLRFVGNGKLKNCLLIGSVSIDAPRKTIFENIYFHRWSLNGVNQVNRDSIYKIYLSGTARDVYNRKTKELSVSDLDTTPVNPFDCVFTHYKLDNFFTPVLEAGKYVYKEGSTVRLTFDSVGNNVRIPICKDYLFIDGAGNIIESYYDLKTKNTTYVEADPTTLKVTRLIEPQLNRTLSILNPILPEWFGAKANDETIDNKDAFQYMHLAKGVFSLGASSTYHLSGDIRVFGEIIIQANASTLKLLPNSFSKCLYEIETRWMQSGITIHDLRLDGNRPNNNLEQDGIYADFHKGKYGIEGYSFDNTYWYNLDVRLFTGSGVNCACPGTSHIYSSYFTKNAKDGISWAVEHFTLVNCTCWENSRHGAFAGGNHWRIIGGAFAHNGENNIHCVGAFENQIIACSVIHSGKFIANAGGGYVADASYTYGYKWVGEGQGTHEMLGGHGIYLEDSYSMNIATVRINNQNGDGIHATKNTRNIIISDSQINYCNVVRGVFGATGGEKKDVLKISSSAFDGVYILSNMRTEAMFFGSSTGIANWNDLKGTLLSFGFGVFEIRDSYYAQNRPTGAGATLSGTIKIINGANGASGRTFIELMDNTCKKFSRYMDIDMSTGAYSNDTNWVEK